MVVDSAPSVFASRYAWSASAWGLIVCLAVGSVVAAEPDLKTIFPLGCPRGGSIEITLAGGGLEQGGTLYFSQPGIAAEHIEKNRYRVTVADDSPLGDCDVWLATSAGLAGPRRFVVSNTPVSLEQADNDWRDAAQNVTLPCIVDARLDAADLDWYSFQGRSGQLVTVACRSASLDSSAQPVLNLFAPDGRQLAHSRAYRREPLLHCRLPDSGTYRLLVRERAYRSDDFSCYRLAVVAGPRAVLAVPHVLAEDNQDPLTLLGYELPGGKAYRKDSGQRVSHPAEPLLDELQVSVCDLVRSPAVRSCFLSPAALTLAGCYFRHQGVSGEVRLGIASGPVVVEVEDQPSVPQPIGVPCRIAGRFQTRGDVDWFRFSAKKDDVLRIETFGERLDQLMDLEAGIHDAAGKQLTVIADLAAAKGVPAKLPLGSLDAAGSWKAPADGAYDLAIRDLYGGSVYGPDRIYEVLIERPRPRFHVVAMRGDEKASRGVTVVRGNSAELQLIALRSGGFAGPIRVRAEQPPPGVSVEPCTIDGKEVVKSIKITATQDSGTGIRPLRLVAAAEIGSDMQMVPVRSAGLLRSGVTRITDGTVIQIAED